MAVPPEVQFGEMLRQLRVDALLTQEELAARAKVAARTISDLERGKAMTPHQDTVLRLAQGLELVGSARARFEAAARGRARPESPVSGAPAMRMLPHDIASFTGREAELGRLLGAANTDGVVSIHAIGGMAGVGKTAFAVHAAHQLATRFPDWQIFVPLHGHTPGRRPVDPADALASLLLTVGVPAAQIPPDLAGRAGLWRHRLATRQLLLVLDDAVGSDQVRPLLPGTAGSLVLITSRRRLTALEEARAISLDTLPPEDAARLLIRLADRPGLNPRDATVAEIARLCGYLPLAVGMLARQLHHHDAWTADGLASDLAVARDRLELMVTENLSVAAAFDLSYQELTQAQQRLFRRLGLHPGSDIDAYAAAALDDTGVAAASRLLAGLHDHYLLTEPARGRYRLHDLIAEHARACAERDDPVGDRDQATGRLLDYYQHTAAVAGALLARQTRTAPDPAALGTPLPALPSLPDSMQALAWSRFERGNLLACLDYATHAGQQARVVALTAAVAALLRHDGPWTEAITRHTTAIAVAARLGDRLGEASALSELGFVRRHTGDYPGAAQAQEEALGIFVGLGDRLGQANALSALGVVRRQQGDYQAAARALEGALGIFVGLGDRLGQANALNGLGVVRRATGDYPGAARALAEALDIFADLGNRLGQANARTELGDVRRAMGDYADAVRQLEAALAIFGDLGNRLGQANALTNLAAVRRMTGSYPQAAEALDRALGIFRDLGDRGAEATVLNGMGELHLGRGDLGRAVPCHQQAITVARAIGSSWDEAHAVAGLGRCALAGGDSTAARAHLREAQEIFQRIGAAEVVSVAAELGALT